MKKFLLKMSIFLLYASFWYTAYPYFVDPFNVFHADNIRANGVMPNKNYIKMKYILNNPDKYDTFIFGSSREGALHNDRIKSERCYNMLYSSGIPGWHLQNIKTFYANNIRPKKIYVAVDYGAICGQEIYDKQIGDPMRCPWEYLKDNPFHFFRLYLNPAMVTKSLKTILGGYMGRIETINVEAFYKYGWDIPYERPARIDWNDKTKVVPALSRKGKDHEGVKFVLSVMKEISEVCNVNGTELVIFINPLHYVTYLDALNNESYIEFLEGLAEISDFINFSSLNDVTMSNDYYLETNHFKAQAGDLIIDIMCNGKSYPELQRQGFGIKVTRENAKDFIAMLKQQAEEYMK